MSSTSITVGFIGLGAMGSGMSRNVARKHGGRTLVFDLDPDAVAKVVEAGADGAASVADIARAADLVFLSLPGGKQVEAVCLGAGGLSEHGREGLMVVDLSTTSVDDARRIEAGLLQRRMQFADAPVARTRQAAEDGTLSIMVGAGDNLFARIEPLLRYMGTDVTHCGDVGCGQVVKLINNTLVFEHVAALAEMMVVAERAGVSPAKLLEAVSIGSGDSFVLRNHGMKALLPRAFPEKAFPSAYVLKDLDYAIELAESTGVVPKLPRLVAEYYQAAVDRGIGEKYFPAIIEIIEDETGHET